MELGISDFLNVGADFTRMQKRPRVKRSRKPLGEIPRLSAFLQADMAITNAAGGDFIITKKRKKDSVER
jgi:hypothetical protein